MTARSLGESKITSKGQVTIPVKVREKLELDGGDYVLFMEEDGRIFIVGGTIRPKSRR